MNSLRRWHKLRLPTWRREAMRTTLWLIPAVLVVAATILFVVSYELDRSVYLGHLSLPSWIRTGSADAGRQILTSIAAAVITVVGVVFSITILALTLASQQFGPRMLRNFIRDIGTQVTLGVFVATFVYAVLALGSITNGSRGEFVPHISITVALVLLLGDLGVLIYFIHHVAVSIQLPEVIAAIARDLSRAIELQFPAQPPDPPAGTASDDAALVELVARIEDEGVEIPALSSGYLQFVSHEQLVGIAAEARAVVRLAYRPGHFVVAGRPLATVWPSQAGAAVAEALARAHVTGPHRTLEQDPLFAIDQLVEIAIRALSPAVNDTFTALTCIDWLSDGLCRAAGRAMTERTFRDGAGEVRVIEPGANFGRLVNRAFDKIRQAGRGMPAVDIRLIDALARVVEYTTQPDQREVVLRQARLVAESGDQDIAQEADRLDTAARFASLLALVDGMADDADGNHRAARSAPTRSHRRT